MAQNSQPLDLEEALQRLYQVLPIVSDTTELMLSEAYGRVLSRSVAAPINLPPFNASAMDGYALRLEDFLAHPEQPLHCIGESLAGHPFQEEVGVLECVRVFTGAKVPPGADQVLLQEEVHEVTDNRVRFKPHRPVESYVRPIGHDVHAGRQLAAAGDHLNGFTLGTLAGAGIDRVNVFTLPVVGVFSTGDELVDPGTPPESLVEGQIYDSNRFTVLNLLRNAPCDLIDLGRLADDPQAVHDAFVDASRRCDLLITSGGVSVGDADFVTHTIQTLGELSFWRLNLKPGKPLAFGRIDNCYVFGLPGNPVSTIVTLLLLAKPAIYHHAGGAHPTPLRVPAQLTDRLLHTPGRTEYQRGILNTTRQSLRVQVTGDQSSNRLSSFHRANCLIEVPRDRQDMEAGEQVMVLPFNGLVD